MRWIARASLMAPPGCRATIPLIPHKACCPPKSGGQRRPPRTAPRSESGAAESSGRRAVSRPAQQRPSQRRASRHGMSGRRLGARWVDGPQSAVVDGRTHPNTGLRPPGARGPSSGRSARHLWHMSRAQARVLRCRGAGMSISGERRAFHSRDHGPRGKNGRRRWRVIGTPGRRHGGSDMLLPITAQRPGSSVDVRFMT